MVRRPDRGGGGGGGETKRFIEERERVARKPGDTSKKNVDYCCAVDRERIAAEVQVTADSERIDSEDNQEEEEHGGPLRGGGGHALQPKVGEGNKSPTSGDGGGGAKTEKKLCNRRLPCGVGGVAENQTVGQKTHRGHRGVCRD